MKKTCALNILLLFLIQFFCYGQGLTYSGTYKFSTPISLNGVNNQIISGLEIENSNGDCIRLVNCSNITIQNCKLGPSKGEGISIYNSKNITVTNCTMESIRTGVLAVESNGIKVNYNEFRNILGPFPRGQMAQFDEVNGSGNSISYNICENLPGQSDPEDAISLFKSNGTSGDTIKVVGNWIRGGGPSISGGGIIAGDNGESYILIENNILVNPGQYGIAITSGHHITIRNNKIYAKRQPFTFWGLMAYIQYPIATYSNTIEYNEVNFRNKDGVLKNMWENGKSGLIVGWYTNLYNPNLSESILPTKIIGRSQKD